MSEGTKDLKGIKYLGNFVYESNKVPKCNFMLLVSNRKINVLCMSKLKTEGQSQGYQHLLSTSWAGPGTTARVTPATNVEVAVFLVVSCQSESLFSSSSFPISDLGSQGTRGRFYRQFHSLYHSLNIKKHFTCASP